MRLQTICHEIGVTDLHSENVILVAGVKWVPIDLEVIKPGHLTGLYGRNEPMPLILSDKEKGLIKQFNTMQYYRLARTVPVATHALSEAGKDFNGARELTKSLYPIISKEFHVSTFYHELEKLIELDIQNGDIPLFSKKEGVLYYGDQDKGIAHERRKKDEHNK